MRRRDAPAGMRASSVSWLGGMPLRRGLPIPNPECRTFGIGIRDSGPRPEHLPCAFRANVLAFGTRRAALQSRGGDGFSPSSRARSPGLIGAVSRRAAFQPAPAHRSAVTGAQPRIPEVSGRGSVPTNSLRFLAIVRAHSRAACHARWSRLRVRPRTPAREARAGTPRPACPRAGISRDAAAPPGR